MFALMVNDTLHVFVTVAGLRAVGLLCSDCVTIMQIRAEDEEGLGGACVSRG